MTVDELMRDQGGLVSRRQVLESGARPSLIARHLRRNAWSVVHPGVYVGHTGAPTDGQLLMAAVLYAWPAALAGESALIAHGVRNIRATCIRVAVDARRRVEPPTGVRIQRVVGLDDRVSRLPGRPRRIR